MAIEPVINGLIEKSSEAGLIAREDQVYVRNQILGLLHLKQFEEHIREKEDGSIPDHLDQLVDYAIQQEIIEDVLYDKEILSAKIMDLFLAKPSEINKRFQELYQKSPESATNYFYNLSKNSNYIQTKRISNNIHFKSETPYGEMDITINMSKPEKDPKQIKRERMLKQGKKYPKCLLCVENEGYPGHIVHPARSNHRVIKLNLVNENWYLQYSPYVYYNEHCIILAEEHRDMTITRTAFERLTEFTTQFPHYFAGSNADLPIVGGSILSHDHYQGGSYKFAMDRAPEQFSFTMEGFEEVNAAVVKWPLSVIRLKSDNRESLLDAAEHILTSWRQYSDDSAEIKAFTGETPHNTITPIARKTGDVYQLDLVLRNNRTSDEHPGGIFHPHADVHHIKRENIGLIEVMGLAVLPARLKEELDAVKRYLLGESVEIAEYHKDWVNELQNAYPSFTADNINGIIRKALGNKFSRALEDAGVFKQTDKGEKAFKKFLDFLNQSDKG